MPRPVPCRRRAPAAQHLLGGEIDLAAYSSAALRHMVAPRTALPPGHGPRGVGQAEVEEIREATAAFRVLDNRLGGRIRRSVVEYLHVDVVPLLQQARCTEQVRRDLFSAAAELAQLAGWQAYDLELHSLAQRYFVQALAMASHAGDAGLAGEILAAMSHQAVYLSQPDNALDLAQAAQAAARRAGLGVLLTECLVQEAHALAARPSPDPRACSAALSRAETVFARAARNGLPGWLSYFDEAYLAAKIAHCFRVLGHGEQTRRYAQASLEMDQRYVRGKTFNLVIPATGQAMTGDLDQACRTGREAVDLATGLGSARVLNYLRGFHHHRREHGDAPAVTEWADYAREQLPALWLTASAS